MARHKDGRTSNHILDIAQRLVQTRGFNAFSYADIATDMQVTRASLHYHFPSKEDLGLSLVERYRDGFRLRLEAIRRTGAGPGQMLRDYVAIYSGVLADRRMCLCGMLAAEFETLPQTMQEALERFFDMNEIWLESILSDGARDGSLKLGGEARQIAQFMVATLEGAMMLARSRNRDEQFHLAAQRLLEDVGA